MRTIWSRNTRGIAVVSVLALAVTACSALGAEGTGGGGATGDYPSYASAEELFASADLVVEATVEGSRTEPIDVAEDAAEEGLAPIEYTVYSLTVSEVFSGAAPEGVLEVKHPVGQEDLELREGSAYVLFLQTYGDEVPPSLLNPDQGAHLVGDDGSLEPVGGSLEVDRDDLG
ncbi:hypothetical protein NE857_27605 [Nocardiopsis exhalans]|uniref:Lipoprotein n=1 Tax=Nocardiopsis exhalans TaxID=163604 RepID=A0ABY5D6L6_9ACTN|nr:hypothetical protein [Nocardiopsis exhalans]USY19000.1 hypothetical protein NE857_27605 [Nocardiopsis exhalans]